MNNFLILGWFLVKPNKKADLGYECSQYYPESVISASSCICDIHPDFIEDICSDNDELSLFTQHNSINWRCGDGFYLPSWQIANEMNQRFFNSEYELVALAIQEDQIKHLLKTMTSSDVPKPIIEAQIWTGKETIIGYEVLVDALGGHSYLCHNLEVELAELFNTTTNSYGLIPNYDAAEKLANYINEGKSGERGEPGHWLPFV